MTEPTSFDALQEKYWHDETHLSRRDPRHPVIAAYVRPKIAFIEKHISLGASPRMIDIGAGNGYFSYWLNERGPTVATDYSAVMLQNNPVPEKRVMDGRHLEYPDNTFDLSFCHAVFHHIDRADRVVVLREMARVSKRYVAFIEPNRNNPLIFGFSLLKKEEHGALVFTNGYLNALTKEAGLRIIRSCTWGLLTPNRMPFAKILLPIFGLFERPLPLGVTNIVIAEKI